MQGRPGAHNPGFVHIGKHVGTSGGITGGPPKRSTCPVATPPHKSLYSFTRLEQQLFWPVKKEQQLALAAEGESAIYRARSAEH